MFKTATTAKAITMIVTGIAVAQKIHCLVSMLRMSYVFMPKSEEMKDKGRKIIVTTVKTRIAASWRSLVASMRWMFCDLIRKRLIEYTFGWNRDNETSRTHIGSNIYCARVHLFETCNALFCRLHTFFKDGLIIRQ